MKGNVSIMPYVDYMKASIEKVEASRHKRIQDFNEGRHHPRIPVEEVDNLLQKYHPDYIEGTKRTVKIVQIFIDFFYNAIFFTFPMEFGNRF